MTMTRGTLSNLIVPGFRKVVFETYKERPIEGDKLVNTPSAGKRAYVEDFPVAGFGTLQSKAEGGAVAYQDAIQGAIKRYTWTSYGLGFRITEEIYDDDLYGITGGKMSKALGRSARNNKEIVMAAPYNNSFNTAFTGFEASVSLCSVSHLQLRTGDTVTNRPASDADFSLLALQAAVEHFHGLEDESGIPLVMIPKMVAHSVGDYWLVNQVLKSANLPGGNVNDMNQLSHEGIKPHLGHYFTDADAWWLIGDQHDVNYFERKPFTFKNTDDFDTGDAKFKGTRRNGSGFGDWRGIYGTQGA